MKMFLVTLANDNVDELYEMEFALKHLRKQWFGVNITEIQNEPKIQ